MNEVANMPLFILIVSGQEVHVGIGPGSSHRVELVDFAENDATD